VELSAPHKRQNPKAVPQTGRIPELDPYVRLGNRKRSKEGTTWLEKQFRRPKQSRDTNKTLAAIVRDLIDDVLGESSSEGGRNENFS